MPLSRIKSQMESSQLRLDSSAASTDVNDRVLLNGTDSSSTGDGYAVILEDATANALDGGVERFSEVPILPHVGCKVYHKENQGSISSATQTKLTYDAIEYDTHGYYDQANARYTPQVAGYYHITAIVKLGAAVDCYDMISEIHAGGSSHERRVAHTRLRYTPRATNADWYASLLQVTDTRYFNGTTDFCSIYFYAISEDSGTISVDGATSAVTDLDNYGNSNNGFFSVNLLHRTK